MRRQLIDIEEENKIEPIDIERLFRSSGSSYCAVNYFQF